MGLYIGLEPERLRFHHAIGKTWNPVQSSLERQCSIASVGKSARLHFFQDALIAFSDVFWPFFWPLAKCLKCLLQCSQSHCNDTHLALPLRSLSLGLKQPSTCPEGLLQERTLWFQSASVISFLLPTCCPGITWNNVEQH